MIVKTSIAVILLHLSGTPPLEETSLPPRATYLPSATQVVAAPDPKKKAEPEAPKLLTAEEAITEMAKASKALQVKASELSAAQAMKQDPASLKILRADLIAAEQAELKAAVNAWKSVSINPSVQIALTGNLIQQFECNIKIGKGQKLDDREFFLQRQAIHYISENDKLYKKHHDSFIKSANELAPANKKKICEIIKADLDALKKSEVKKGEPISEMYVFRKLKEIRTPNYEKTLAVLTGVEMKK